VVEKSAPEIIIIPRKRCFLAVTYSIEKIFNLAASVVTCLEWSCVSFVIIYRRFGVIMVVSFYAIISLGKGAT